MNKGYREAVSEALLRQAVIDDHMNELNDIPSKEELIEIYTFSERHELRMKKLFAADKRRERATYLSKFVKRAAAVIVITITILFSVLMTVPVVRAAVSETIMEWFEKFTRYSYNENGSEITNIDWNFEYIPNGYELSDTYEVGATIYSIYTNKSSDEIIFSYTPMTNISLGIDNEHSSFSIVIENYIEYHVYKTISEEYPSRIVWCKNDFTMNLKGYCSIDDLLRMAQSILK